MVRYLVSSVRKLQVVLGVLACMAMGVGDLHAQMSSRTRTFTYYDDATRWVLGQVSSRSTDGVVAEQTAFDAAMVLPVETWVFGKSKSRMSYNGDGTLAGVRDGNGNLTQFSNWRFGVPQAITYADGTGLTAVVGDQGWIQQVTDANGYATQYAYDPMGRLASIAYPTDDSVPWNALSQSFVQVGASEYGIPAGHWRQTRTTGQATHITYFDALWRPLLVAEYDAANSQGTVRFNGFEYDPQGRVVFASYPAAQSTPDRGVWTTYDGLGREIARAADSEQGLLTTTTAYLHDAAGAMTLARDPRGNEMRTWYRTYAEPDYSAPVRIAQPEGITTLIERDVFGKALSLSRLGPDGSALLTRLYTYNGQQELCRSTEPETGVTLMGYDAAGNLAWSASGLPASSGCDNSGSASEVLARKASRSYDRRNRISTLSFPDGNGNQTWTYTPDGLPSQVVTQDVGSSTQAINTYTYNKRRLLTAETSAQAGAYTWSLGYGYDANGSLAGIQYPSGLFVDYAPNALGQPTRAGSYVSGVAYHPNGGMRQFVYGNGIVHTMQQNQRQLPEHVSDAGVLDNVYSYDAAGNVAGIVDVLDATRTRSMSYDGVDRLTRAVSPSFGGSGEMNYTYDSLDNLRTVLHPGVRSHTYWYDAANRLGNVMDETGATIIGLAYDAQGNLHNKNGQVFQFDYGNRLREAVGAERYRYDAHGRRVVSESATGNITSMYGQDGVLRRQDNDRLSSSVEYVHLNGSLVAKVVTPTTPPTPVISAPAASTGTHMISWNAIVSAIRYEVQEQLEQGAWQDSYSGAGLSTSFSGVPTGVHGYRVRACRATTCGGWSLTAVVYVNLAPTGVPALEAAPALSGNGSFALSWNSVTAALRYRLEEQSGAGQWSVVQENAALSSAQTGRADGTYSYRVSACNDTDCGGYSAVRSVEVLRVPSGAPVVSVPAVSPTGSYTVSWTSVSGAATYQLEESTNGGSWIVLQNTAATSLGITAKPDGGYAYRVAACNRSGCGSYSATVTTGVLRPPVGTPGISAPGLSNNGSYTVSWSTVAAATSYRLEESIGGGGWTQVQSGAGLQAAFSGKADGFYSYRAAGCNSSGCGGYSATATVQVLRPPGTPGLSVPAQSSDGYYTVSWSAVASVANYVLEESFNGGGWVQVANGGGTSYGAPGKADGTYSYRVAACNAGGCSGYSGIGTITVLRPPTTPAGLTARYIVVNAFPPWQVRYFASWGAVAGATSYQVQSNRGNYTVPQTSIQFDYMGAPAGATFSVRACNAAGCSALSTVVTANGG